MQIIFKKAFTKVYKKLSHKLQYKVDWVLLQLTPYCPSWWRAKNMYHTSVVCQNRCEMKLMKLHDGNK